MLIMLLYLIVIAMHSSSDLERALIGCFLEDHDIQFDPKNTQISIVLRLVIGQPPQSKSQKAYKI